MHLMHLYLTFGVCSASIDNLVNENAMDIQIVITIYLIRQVIQFYVN